MAHNRPVVDAEQTGFTRSGSLLIPYSRVTFTGLNQVYANGRPVNAFRYAWVKLVHILPTSQRDKILIPIAAAAVIWSILPPVIVLLWGLLHLNELAGLFLSFSGDYQPVPWSWSASLAGLIEPLPLLGLVLATIATASYFRRVLIRHDGEYDAEISTRKSWQQNPLYAPAPEIIGGVYGSAHWATMDEIREAQRQSSAPFEQREFED